MKKILVVEDDRAMRRVLVTSLVKNGYDVRAAEDAQQAFAVLADWKPSLILLDIGLPDMDGLDVLRQLRRTLPIPIIFVTSRRRELDEVLGLEMGADDYITKPFDLDVLLTRVKVAIRRTFEPSAEPEKLPVIVGDLAIDPRAFQARLDNQLLELTPKEFNLLHYLAQRPEEVVTVDEILSHVWGDDWVGETQTVYVHMRSLRKKLECDANHPRRLLTVRGIGYKFIPQTG